MSLKQSLLPLVIGLAAGVSAGLYFASEKNAPRSEMPVVHSVAVASPIADTTDLAAELKLALAENARLQRSLDEMQVATHPASPEKSRSNGSFSFSSDKPPTADEREQMIVQIRPHMRQFVEGRLKRYQMRLNMNDDQFQAMSDLMLLRQEQEHRQMMSMHERGPDGSLVESKVEPISANDLLDMASDILSPEQLEEYDSILGEERSARNDMMATAQLSQISSIVKMTDEQKDAAYSIIYGVADQAGDGPAFFASPDTQKSIEEGLSEILSEEQYKSYLEYQKQNSQGGGTRAMFMGG